MSAGLPLKPPDEAVQDAASAASATRAAACQGLVKLQHRHERILRNLDRSDPLHSSFAFLLPLQQFAFPGYVTAIAFREHVLSHRGDGFAGDHLTADGGLD